MFYHIETEERTAGDRKGTVYTLQHKDGAQAEIWPAAGFNGLRWRLPAFGAMHELLYASPEWAMNPVPTRSGIPILFPFPNRIRDGQFTCAGRTFRWPLNDPAKKNAIHGSACRHAWRISGYGADQDSAWVHGVFQPGTDAPETADLWPADAALHIVCRLNEHALRLECEIENASAAPFPFGLGFHPYLRFPSSHGKADAWKLWAPARSLWELVESIPTGQRIPVSDNLNWNTPRQLAGTQLDTLYTDLGAINSRPDGLVLRAELGHSSEAGALQLWTSPDFRELVLFTPPHREAVAIEPYTCATDAVNLAARAIDGGWKELPIGGRWNGIVEFRWEAGRDF